MKRLEHVNFSLWDVKYCANISYQLTDIHKYPNVIENFCNSALLPVTLVESLLQAKRLREQADYYDEWPQAGAESLLKAAKKFLIIARQLTSKVI